MLKTKTALVVLLIIAAAFLKWLEQPSRATPSWERTMQHCVDAVEPESIEELTAAYAYCGNTVGADAN